MHAKKHYALVATIWLGFISSSALANTLYKWVDEDGNITYQDQPPPEDSEVLEEKYLENTPQASQNQGNSQGTSNTNTVIVYTANDCPVCKFILFQLDDYKVPYREENLNDNRVAQNNLLEKSGSLSIPTVLIGDTYLTRFSGKALEDALRNAGYPISKQSDNDKPETENEEDQDIF